MIITKRTPPHTYDIGDRIRVWVTFSDQQTEEPVDPEVVVCTVKNANGVTSALDVENPEPGLWQAFYEIDGPDGLGAYAFDAFTSAGKKLGAQEGEFRIRPRVVPR